MIDDVDIFDNLVKEGYPRDYRWDRDKNARLLNIVFAGGTFGNFLRYFLEKFSANTPDIEKDPFTPTGTSHNLSNDDFSGLIQMYHQSFINDNRGETDLPVCMIVPSTGKHYLYLKKAQVFKPNDYRVSPDDLWRKAIGEMSDQLKDQANNIIKLYDVKDSVHFTWLPKFIIRDWYKLEFLQPRDKTFNHRWFEIFKGHRFWQDQKVHHLDLETFFNWESFLINIRKLNDIFGLCLDFERQSEMQDIFNKGLALDFIRQECNLAEAVLENRSDARLDNLDVATEGYIYAEIEKANPDIQMPLTNRFFRDMEEIRQFLAHFPNWYRRPNPNLG